MSKKSNSSLYWGLFVVALALGIVALALFSDGGASTTRDHGGAIANGVASDWARGNLDSEITLIEYADFQCAACASFHSIISRLVGEFGDRVKFVYRHFPLGSIHPNAFPAALASEAAGRQGKFWEMHDMLYERQGSWSRSHSPNSVFSGYASDLGLDLEKFNTDLQDTGLEEKIRIDMGFGNSAGVNGTPSFYLNGERLENVVSYEIFQSLLQAAVDSAPGPGLGEGEEVHEHADLAVYINGDKYEMSREQYIVRDGEHNDSDIHVHDDESEILHKHGHDLTVGDFFSSIDIELSPDCLFLDTGASYCSDDDNSLKFFVNGIRNNQFADYKVQDLDRILVSFGSLADSTLVEQIASVGDEACIYSGTCPERGTSPEEEVPGE